MTKYKELKQKYDDACNEIIKHFIKKQGYEFSYWVADEIGRIACFTNHFLRMSDIILDLNKKAEKGLIFKWQDDCIENETKYINYNSYIMGLRFKDL